MEHGVLGFEVYLSDVAGLSRFHFDDFEGPDAPALKKTPVRATVTPAAGRPVPFTLTASGWYPREGSFAFGVTAASRLAASPQRRLLSALAGASALRVVITDIRDPGQSLDFVVPVAGRQADFTALLAGLK